MASRGLRKTFFFHLKACERRNFDFCVFLRMCSVTVTGPVLSWLYDRNEDKWTEQLHYTSVRTHKNQRFSSHRPSNGKKLCFS